MIYKINKNENSVRIFGSKFVEHKKDICKAKTITYFIYDIYFDIICNDLFQN